MASESSVPSSVTRPADVGLKREIGLIGGTWASETSLIGSGWLFGSFYAAAAVGTAAFVGWIIAGIVVIILALVHAELGAMYPVSGGTARFPHFAFGSVAGISFGFFSWLQAVVVAPVECYAVLTYGSYYWPSLLDKNGNATGLGFLWTVILMVIFTALNFFAMRLFNRINAGITWWKIAIPVLAIIFLFTQFHASNFGSHGGFMPYGIKALFGALPSAGIIFAYLGFEQADQLAGEIKNPQKNLPRAIIFAVLIAVVIYCLLQIVFIGALRPNDLAHGWAALANNQGLLSGPLAFLAGAVGLGWLATVLRIDAFISPGGTGLIYLTSTSRIGYGVARNRYFPQIFAKVDSRGVPWVSLILAFVFGLVFLLPFPSWHSLIALVTSASVLMYAGAPLSLGALRRQVPDAPRPYRLPGAAALAPIAFIIANLIIYWSGFTVLWKLGVCIVAGYILIGISMAFDKDRPPLDWKAAQWLPVYLIGMGIISWQGQYTGETSNAPPLATMRIPFWWDMAIVAVFSLIIYYWAMAVRAPREEVLELVGRQSAPAEETAPAA
ncbi:MAG: APC family permease [Nocardiopsaceae bacterium]|jgi:amino acid transporter|nr:APC family permease [Nocardiopsaceae bacterium]